MANKDGPGIIHNLAKMTKANLVRGELATFWRGQRRDVNRMINVEFVGDLTKEAANQK